MNEAMDWFYALNIVIGFIITLVILDMRRRLEKLEDWLMKRGMKSFAEKEIDDHET